MKIYTEEQVIKALFTYPHPESTSEELLKELTPIELPSDEEIAEGLKKVIGNIGELEHRKLTFIGALWMKEQILNQNK